MIKKNKKRERERARMEGWGGEVHAWVRSLEFTKNRILADGVD